MGKGDQKSRKGKISMGSYGVSRLRKLDKPKLDKPTAPEPEAKPTSKK